MRADVNISVREVGAEEFGTRTEMKNLNSFKAIARAIEGERERQIDLIESGEEVIQETRRWDDNKEYSYAMRSKEDAQDYRYFPEPDLPPVIISQKWIDIVTQKQPEFRDAKKARYQEEYGLPEYDTDLITSYKKLADLFEEAVAICDKPKEVSNWIMGETMRLSKEKNVEPEKISFSPKHLAQIIEMVDKGEINRKVARTVFEAVFTEDVDPEQYVEENSLKSVNDEGALRAVIEEIVAKNPQSVEDYRAGKKKAMGFFVGQTMRAMQGKADPAMVNQILAEILEK
jgi:aspartyl-tRNA(Asn)/glutamyl-tRNA(Gln) amidotransferase subunit B